MALVAIVLFSATSAHFNLFDMLADYARAHDEWQVDEIIMVVLFSSFPSLLLLLRRAGDLRAEIVRREAAELRATTLARHDPLTGLPNRRVLGEDLESWLDSVKAAGAECAVFLIDLDQFKPVNDVHGHVAGDAVLVEAAERITAIVGSHGTVARMGGDEFACVIAYKAGSGLPARLAGQSCAASPSRS